MAGRLLDDVYIRQLGALSSKIVGAGLSTRPILLEKNYDF